MSLHIYPTTDQGNSERYAAQAVENFRFVPGIGWYSYSGGKWRRTQCGEQIELAKRVARSIFREAEIATDSALAKALGEHAVKSEGEARLQAMVRLAESDPALVVPAAKLDADPWLSNALNCTIDLRTGKPRPHNPADLITKQCPVNYDPMATPERFLAFVNRIFGGNQPTIAYVQKLLGMAASGDCSTQILPIFWGDGANGKSTLLEICQYIYGDYSSVAPDSLLTMSNSPQHPCELADLQGRRLVIASETEATSRLRLQLVKKLTGERTIKARRMYGEWYEFSRTHSIFLMTNNKPRVSEDSEAAWRRIRLVPFNVVIPEPERDPHLAEKLQAEASGILAWLVMGCLAWQTEGLETPEEVGSATQHYREESDPLGEFVGECCQLGPEHSTPSGELRRAYEQHCQSQGTKPITGKAFTTRLARLGATAGRTYAGRCWQGIGLTSEMAFAGAHGA
jgi:putative DNA primase/helicase